MQKIAQDAKLYTSRNLFLRLFLISCFLAGIFSFLIFDLTFASSVYFSSEKISVQENKNFNVKVYLNPQGIKNYTLKLELKYPADLIEIRLFQMSSEWIALSQPGYDLIDNNNGVLIKTGGYPGGVSQNVLFGTISFHSKKSGDGIIQLGNNAQIFDANNQNVLSGNPNISINIIEKIQQAIETQQVDAQEQEQEAKIAQETIDSQDIVAKSIQESKTLEQKKSQATITTNRIKKPRINLLASIGAILNKEIKIPFYAIILLIAALIVFTIYRKKYKT